MNFEDVVRVYLRSPQFEKLAISTKRQRTISLEHLMMHLQGYDIKKISRPQIIAIRDDHWEETGKCRTMMTALKTLLSYAHDRGWVSVNLAASLSDMPESVPIPRWHESEIERFMSNAPARLRSVMMLALYTGQRCSDLCRMDWSNYDGWTIHLTQQKTGKTLDIPVHAKLKLYLDGMKRRTWGDRQPILTNQYGAAWQPDSMRVSMKKHCRKIGLDKQLHGIRKTTASILAEMGCTPHQIAAITGHQSLKEVQRYTMEAEQKRMAQEAIGKWQAQ